MNNTQPKFNPKEWLTSDNLKVVKNNQALAEDAGHKQSDLYLQVKSVVEQIEKTKTDITGAYDTWRNIGFAISEDLGESGRDFYHRISCFYPEYSISECDKQYTNCLKSNNTGITISTFFHHAKQAGINLPSKPLSSEVSTKEELSSDPEASGLAKEDQHPNSHTQPLPHTQTPTLPNSLYPNLPDFLQTICSHGDTNLEKDTLLLGSITTLSSCMPNIYGLYDNKKVFPNLFLFITAKASAGKGMLNHCRQLVQPVHKKLKQIGDNLKQAYEHELSVYNSTKKKNPDAEKPTPPPIKMLFIPANSSATGVFQLLSDNEGKGLIFETEGDTLANTFKSDYGNYSDGFRKAFHHEAISYFRRANNENVEIEHPCLSAVLSGTPKQVTNLIPSAENGLFSRFMFYYINIEPKWKDVFANSSDIGLDEQFLHYGNDFYAIYNELQESQPIQFSLTETQQQQFNEFFNELQSAYYQTMGDDYMATIRRLGLITFRIAMILSVLRFLETGEIPVKITCTNDDFNTAKTMVEILVKHAQKVFSELPGEATNAKAPNRKEHFLEALPQKFTRQQYADIAQLLNIPDKTAQAYITQLCIDEKINRVKNGEYKKPHL